MTIKYLDSKRIIGLSQSVITHDTTSSTESSGSVSSLTHSMTVADNSNRVLIACSDKGWDHKDKYFPGIPAG